MLGRNITACYSRPRTIHKLSVCWCNLHPQHEVHLDAPSHIQTSTRRNNWSVNVPGPFPTCEHSKLIKIFMARQSFNFFCLLNIYKSTYLFSECYEIDNVLWDLQLQGDKQHKYNGTLPLEQTKSYKLWVTLKAYAVSVSRQKKK